MTSLPTFSDSDSDAGPDVGDLSAKDRPQSQVPPHRQPTLIRSTLEQRAKILDQLPEACTTARQITRFHWPQEGGLAEKTEKKDLDAVSTGDERENKDCVANVEEHEVSSIEDSPVEGCSRYRVEPSLLGDCELLLAARDGHVEEVERLLAAGADPNSPNHNGETPLLAAAATNEVAVVGHLLGARADPTLRADTGMRALDFGEGALVGALMAAVAPASEGLIPDAWLFEMALEKLPERLREDIANAVMAETRQLQI